MISILVSFLVALVSTLFIIRLSRQHKNILDHVTHDVQRFHSRPVPRFGGLGILIAALVGASVACWRAPPVGQWLLLLLLCALPAFGCGIVEDYTKNVSAMRRLMLTMAAAAIGYIALDAAITRIDLPLVDGWLKYAWLSLPFTVFAVGGIANAINIVDGFNGLASVVTMFMLLSIAYVAWQVNDTFIMTAAFIMVGAIAGFFVWNFPYGLIFLGDGGAYFIGFMLGELTVLLIARNPQVSAWYALLLLIYPVFETLFSIYRKRFVRGGSPGVPDGIHLHMLIFKRLVRWTIGRRDARALIKRNSLTSPYLWVLSLMAVIPATLFWRNCWILIGFCLCFVAAYVWLYMQIVQFNAPRWMIIRRQKK
ncbi:MAG: glycosyl transferase [Burkholderiaceae bacterium]|nr:glycosyl transferase [Burkholderiaceae bacterium]